MYSSFENSDFLPDVTARSFSFPVFVGFQAPNLSEYPRHRLETEAGTGEDRVASADKESRGKFLIYFTFKK